MSKTAINMIFILILVIVISSLFVVMIKQFFMTLLLAAIFSALFQGVFKRILKLLRNRPNQASIVTLLLILLIIIIPLLGVLGIVAGQAVDVSQTVKPWVTKQLENPDTAYEFINKIPYSEVMFENKDEILTKAGEIVGKLGNLIFEQLSSATKSTVNFLFLTFVFFYAMFFFLKDGTTILFKLLQYLPMKEKEKLLLLNRFTSISRATLKGTLLIGLIQGGLAGLAFWIVGIESVLFWTLLMVVLSIIPAIGTTLIWLPAAIILLASGHIWEAIFLLIFCGGVVGSIDNFLRPKFIGKDTKMHELMIFLSTLGGLSLFGISGFILGPILAALFVTSWDIYGDTFREFLPELKQSREEISLESKTNKSVKKVTSGKRKKSISK